MKEWVNWSGSLRFRPARLRRPRTADEVGAVVREARAAGKKVRAVGAGHSSVPLVATDDVLISLERFQAVTQRREDKQRDRATVGAGVSLQDAGKRLFELGLAVHNLGDVDVQTVVGAISTGTHGSGDTLQNLATMLVGCELVTGTGETVRWSDEGDLKRLLGARVGLGALGILVSATLQLVKPYRLCRREYCTSISALLPRLGEALAAHRNLDFYWYPRRDEVKLRTMVLEEDAGPPSADLGRLLSEERGLGHEVLPRTRTLKFEELEYAVPFEAGPPCFQAVRQRMLAVHRREVGWRVLYRIIAADEAYLSTAHGQKVVAISLHHNAGLPYEPFFRDLEPIFRAHGGRPHWAKKHTLNAASLRPLYPAWDTFQRLRGELDPDGVFAAPYLVELLGPVERR